MRLEEIMTKNVEVIPAGATVREAAVKMRDLNVGSVPVVEGSRAIGIITDRDITVRSTAEGHDPENVLVREVMTGDFVHCYVDQDVEEASRLMREHQIRRIPILDRENQLVGIVSLGDISVDMDDSHLSGKTLEDISKPSEPDR